MFTKIVGFVSLVGLLGASSLVACSDSGGDSTPTPDAGADVKVTPKDTGTPDTSTATDTPPACFDESAAGAYDTTKVVVAAQKGACTAADVTAFQAACFGNGTDATCTQFGTDHPACASCLYLGDKTDASGKNILPALVPFGESSVIPNTEACAAVTLKNEAACGLAYVNETTCLVSSCATCEDADFDACVNASAEGVCADALVDATGTCGKAFTDGKTAIDAACNGTGFDDTFAKVAAVLCQ